MTRVGAKFTIWVDDERYHDGFYDFLKNRGRFGESERGPYGRRMPVPADNVLDRVDHLVYAVPDLAVGVAQVEVLFQVSAKPGGRHPDFGTANALVALGGSRYLEIVGPDPDRMDPAPPSIFLVDQLAGPRLVTWAAKSTDLSEAARHRQIPSELGAVSAGQRTRVDGTTVSWQLTDPYADRLGGVVPFLIDWGDSTHPTAALDQPCTLISLEIGHPNPERVVRLLDDLDVLTSVTEAPIPRLTATITTPTGSIGLA